MTLPRDALAALAAECDFDGLGIAPAFPVPVDSAAFSDRVTTACPEELAYLARSLDRRLDPARVLPGIRSVVVGYVSYAGALPEVLPLPEGHARISRFAGFTDYHKTVGARFERLASILTDRFKGRTRWYVDTGPVLEKAYAVAAGLGFIGKNSLFISPRHGSFVFLGVVLTDLEADGPMPMRSPSGCGACHACQDACPGGALHMPYILDVPRCLAHLTVTARELGNLSAQDLAGNLYGCDVCQDVCAFNRNAEHPVRPEFAPRPGLDRPRIDDILAMDDAALDDLLATTPIRPRNRAHLRSVARIMQENGRHENSSKDDE